MKNYLSMSLRALTFTFLFAVAGAVSAFAVVAPNLSVLTWQGSSTPLVESPYQYTTRVQNIGNRVANGVKIVVDFPLTATSPNKYILGKLSGLQQGCSVVANKLQCDLGALNPNQMKMVTFTYEFQVSTTPATFRSTATTTTSGEQNPYNNFASTTPTLTYPDNVIPGGSYLITSCSGRGLTSFYDCEVSPGSTQSFVADLNLGGTLTVPIAPDYFGLWDQNSLPTNKTLHFTIDAGSGTEVEFNGFASSGTCFKGIATFPQSPTYNAAYRVCKQ